MFGQTFYFQTLRKYVVLFGSLFKDIEINREDKNGNVTGVIKVPITYAPKDKMMARVMEDPTIQRATAVPTLPLMSFEMGPPTYDATRKLATINKISVIDPTTKSNMKYQYNPVPYNIAFKLYVYSKAIEDGNKIIEQILPFFTPDWTTSVNLIPEMNVTMDVPVVLNTVSFDDTYDGDFNNRRAIIWTLDFTLKGYIYGPVRSNGVIQFIDTNFYVAPTANVYAAIGNTAVSELMTIQPGLTSNGQPTSNISLTIPYQQISVTDDYGYIELIGNPLER